MYVVPESQVHLLQNARQGNFSLYFARMTPWKANADSIEAKYQSGHKKNGPVYDSSIVELMTFGNKLIPQAKKALQAVHARQKTLLDFVQKQGGFAMEVQAKLISPLVSGLGMEHPTETGLILDRNTGMPYIQSGSVKGVLRLGHTLNVAESNHTSEWLLWGRLNKDGYFIQDPQGDQVKLDDREPSLRRYFGDVDTSSKDAVRGQLVFLDAYPQNPPELKTDIMNCHFQKYYSSSSEPPLETEDPNPVKFLAVKEGAIFVFRVFALPLNTSRDLSGDILFRVFGDEDEKALKAMFSRAFTQLGFGGKTAIGYGRFQWDEDKSVDQSKLSSKQKANSSVLDNVQDLVWEKPTLAFTPNNGTISVTHKGKKAEHKGKDIVPEQYHKKLFQRKKPTVVNKVVLRQVGNLYEVLSIE